MKINDRANTLHGHVQVFVRNKKTGEKTLWSESDNVITLSGYQNILLRSFGLRLDSLHKVSYIDSNIGRDTNLVTPDLNDQSVFGIGRKIEDYSPMEDEFSNTHFIQGFMVGNQGAGEDNITTKNTNYSFINLRNPIPFRQTSDMLNPDIANKYLGIYNIPNASELTGFAKSYYIKKFDERPHIYHSWWRDNQKWDYIDPVSTTDLGPYSTTTNKTNRIESYVECKLSLSDNDCFSYFQHAGSNETPAINELGLVAFDTDPGARSDLEALYNNEIKQLLSLIYDNKRDATVVPEIFRLTSVILDAFANVKVGAETVSIISFGNTNVNAFVDTLNTLSGFTPESVIEDPTVLQPIQEALALGDNIKVEALYNQKGDYIYETDIFLDALASANFNSLTTDEAQRIKLITYYTFNSIPLQSNWRTLINYRIYAN